MKGAISFEIKALSHVINENDCPKNGKLLILLYVKYNILPEKIVVSVKTDINFLIKRDWVNKTILLYNWLEAFAKEF